MTAGFCDNAGNTGVDTKCWKEQQYMGHDQCFGGTHSPIFKMEAAASSKMLVPTHQVVMSHLRRLYSFSMNLVLLLCQPAW
jgi:hypothetical protein